jgi:hypothetical protein
MPKLALQLSGLLLLLLAAVVATAEVRESLETPPALAKDTATSPEEFPLTLVEGDEAAAATWIETGRRRQDTRIARLPQPKAPTRRR